MQLILCGKCAAGSDAALVPGSLRMDRCMRCKRKKLCGDYTIPTKKDSKDKPAP